MLAAMSSPALPPSLDSSNSSDEENGKRPRNRGTSVTFSEKVHVYEFQRDGESDNGRLARVVEEGELACQELDSQMSRDLREAEARARANGGPFAGFLSWSAAARMRCIYRLNTVPVQLVRVEQRKIDATLPIHSVRGQIFVQNLSYHKAVRVRYSTDSWRSYRESDAWYSGPVMHDHPGNGNGSPPMSVDAFDFDFAVSMADVNNNGCRATGRVAVLQLAVRYIVEGKEYWDNNGGVNYSLVLRG